MDNWKYDEEEEELGYNEIDDRNAKMIGVAEGTRLIALFLYCPITLILLFVGLSKKSGSDGFSLALTSIILLLLIFYGMLILPLLFMDIDEKYKFMTNKPTKRAARECATVSLFFIIISILPTFITKKEMDIETSIPIIISYLAIYYLSLIVDKILRKIMDGNNVNSSSYKCANLFSYILSPITIILYSIAIFSLLPNKLWHILVFYGVVVLCSIIYTLINIKIRKSSEPENITIDLDEYDLSNVRKYSITILITIGFCLIIIAAAFGYFINNIEELREPVTDVLSIKRK